VDLLSGVELKTYCDLKYQLLAIVGRLQGVQNGWKLSSVEFDCSAVRIPFRTFHQA
jgi:hypothetical protein